MDKNLTPPTSDHDRTRQRLIDGTLLQEFRANPNAGIRLRTDAELEQTLEDALRHHDASQDIHVFGYGSLMWNPAMEVAHVCAAIVPGWHRRFCLRTLLGRGTPEAPGAMLALDRGGTCRGLLFRIEAAKAPAELRLLWRREMTPGAYDARWVWASANGVWHRALAFMAIRTHERYIGGEPIERIASLIRTGKGSLGSSRDYFESTVRSLELLGICDSGIERLRRAIRLADRAADRVPAAPRNPRSRPPAHAV